MNDSSLLIFNLHFTNKLKKKQSKLNKPQPCNYEASTVHLYFGLSLTDERIRECKSNTLNPKPIKHTKQRPENQTKKPLGANPERSLDMSNLSKPECGLWQVFWRSLHIKHRCPFWYHEPVMLGSPPRKVMDRWQDVWERERERKKKLLWMPQCVSAHRRRNKTPREVVEAFENSRCLN